MRTKICVLDGQGGGIGAALIKRIKEVFGESVEILALGTNAVATASMMKARANRGATGENAIIRTCAAADVIVGPVAVTWANAMMGEVTPAMAAAVSSASAPKLLLPLFQEDVTLVGFAREPLPHMVEILVTEILKEYVKHV